MKFFQTSNIYTLNKSTYTNLRWIAYVGQLIAVLTVKFYFEFEYNYLTCILIIFFSLLTNIHLEFNIKQNQLNNLTSTLYLAYDILQLGFLIYLTGGITNPFIFLIIIPAVFSSQYLNIWSSITLILLSISTVIVLTFFYYDLPHPESFHFHAPNYYLYAIPLSIFIGLIFITFFGLQFGKESSSFSLAIISCILS